MDTTFYRTISSHEDSWEAEVGELLIQVDGDEGGYEWRVLDADGWSVRTGAAATRRGAMQYALEAAR